MKLDYIGLNAPVGERCHLLVVHVECGDVLHMHHGVRHVIGTVDSEKCARWGLRATS